MTLSRKERLEIIGDALKTCEIEMNESSASVDVFDVISLLNRVVYVVQDILDVMMEEEEEVNGVVLTFGMPTEDYDVSEMTETFEKVGWSHS